MFNNDYGEKVGWMLELQFGMDGALNGPVNTLCDDNLCQFTNILSMMYLKKVL